MPAATVKEDRDIATNRRVRALQGDGFGTHMPRTGKSKKKVRATTVCQSCGSEFEHPPSQDRTYCSNPCYHEAVSQLSQTKESCSQREKVESVEVFDALDGLHNQTDVTKLLVRAGYETEEDLRQADPRNLLRITGVGKGTVSQLCRNLEEPWPTPFSHGPNPTGDLDHTQGKQMTKSEKEDQQESDSSKEGDVRNKV